MEDFFNWCDANNFINLPTRGVNFTWSNGRRGSRHTEKKLDRSICNLDFIDSYSTVICSTLTKSRSGHFPLLLEFTTSDIRRASQFRFMNMWYLHPNCKRVIFETVEQRCFWKFT
jgi:hypothetical protein